MKLIHKLLATSFAIPAIAVPLATTTSCNLNWGALTPFSIGSANAGGENDPYGHLAVEAYYDRAGEDMLGYLQSNYIVQTSGPTVYAYSSPKQWDADKKSWDKLGTCGWYTSSDAALTSTATYKDGDKNKTSTNIHNATLASNIDFIGYIGTTISSYLSYALQYQASQISVKSNKDLKIAWGVDGTKFKELNYGEKSKEVDSEIFKFFEYNFALSNIVGTHRVKAMLRNVATNFYIQDKMPLPSYAYTGSERVDFSDQFKQVLEGDSWTNRGHYSSKEYNSEKKYTTYTYNAVPFIINVTNMKQTYVDPTNKSNSLFVRDYYSSKSQIKEAVGDSWKETLPELTGVDKKDAIAQHKTFTLSSALDPIAVVQPTKADTRLGEIHGNQFIGLMNYSVIVYDNKPKSNKATISSFNVFPSFFIELFGNDLYKKANKDSEFYIFDEDKINKYTKEFVELISRSKGQGLVAKASDLTAKSKKYLRFLAYMFADGDTKNIITDNILTAE